MAYSIVVGYDGSESAARALRAAIDLAKMAPDGEIIVACARYFSGPAVGFRGPSMGVEQFWEEFERKNEADLVEATDQVRAAGLRVASSCTPDSPAVTIVTTAREADARMIVVGSKGAGAVEDEKTVLGSTTQKVLHEASGIPVLVVS